MVGQSDPNSRGFYGKGYWGRKVFWDNIPTQHQALDTDGYLESLLKTWGEECETFLQQINRLPLQREPYAARGRIGEEEWFYFTEALRYADDYWGDVVRLIGEKLYANMPETDEDTYPSGSLGAPGEEAESVPYVVPSLLADSDMEKFGIADWAAGGWATLTKQTTDPYEGSRYLRVAYGGGPPSYAEQNVLIVFRRYRITGVFRGNGVSAFPVIKHGTGNTIATGTTSTDWQKFDETFTALDTSLRLYNNDASGYSEFDDFNLSLVEEPLLDGDIEKSETLIVDGDCEALDVTDWTAGNSATLTKEGDAYEGLQCLRVAYNGVTNPQAIQDIMSIDKTYRVRGVARSDGTQVPRIYVTGIGNIWVGTSSASWQVFDETIVATAGMMIFQSSASSSGYVEFDSLQLEEVVPLQDGDMERSSTLLKDGDMEAAGVGDWVAFGGAALTKQTTSPYKGLQVLRVTDTGNGAAYQAILTFGKTYRVRGWARGDGAGFPRVGTGQTILWTGDTDTDWQAFDETFVVDNPWLTLYKQGGSGYADFDDLELTLVDDNAVWDGDMERSSTLLEDGDMEASGVAAWSVGNSAILTKQGAAYHGSQCLRVAYNGTSNPHAMQAVLTIGKTYRVVGRTRSDGTSVPGLYMTGVGIFWTGDTNTDWQSFDVTFVATHASLRFWVALSVAGFAEFDDLELTLVDNNFLFDGDMDREWTLLHDQDCENVGVDAWTVGNSATLAKDTDIKVSGNRSLKVSYNGVSIPYATQDNILEIGKVYRLRGWARGDGTGYPKIWSYNIEIWAGTTSTNWQYFDKCFIADGDFLRFYNHISATGDVWFDDLNLEFYDENVIADGDMETAGVGDWTAEASATLTKETGTPHGGSQCLRVAYNGLFGPIASQNVLTIGRNYRIRGWFRGDGTNAPRVLNYGYILVSGTSSNSWQEFDVTFTATHARIRLKNQAGAGYSEFDDITIVELLPDNVILPDGDMERPETLLVDGDCEESGTTDWSSNDATLSKQTGSYKGIRRLRVTATAQSGAQEPRASQAVLEIGKKYRLRGVGRSDGTEMPQVYAGSVLWIGTDSRDWQLLDIEFTATTDRLDFRFLITAPAGTEYVEFDDLELIRAGDPEVVFEEDNLLVDGDMEEPNIDDWTVENDGTFTKETTDPRAGIRCLRIAYNGTNNPELSQQILQADTIFRVRGWFRGDGALGAARIKVHSTTIVSSTSSNDWQFFDEVFTTGSSTDLRLAAPLTFPGYAEFDNVTVTPVGEVMTWIPQNNAILTKGLDSEGDKFLRISYNGTIPYTTQDDSLIIGQAYQLRGKARGDGISVYPRIYTTSLGNIFLGSTSTSWQTFDRVFVATATDFQIIANASAAGYADYGEISVERISNHLLPDGDMEATGVTAWTVGASATLTKETSDPAEGVRNLRVAYNAVTNPFAGQTILTASTAYRIMGWFRGDGSAYANVRMGGISIISSTTSTTWQFFDTVFFNTSETQLGLMAITSSAGYAEFDGVRIQSLGAGYDDWDVGNDAALQKPESDTAEGDRCLRVNYTKTTNPYAKQDALVSGQIYRVTGSFRGDGTANASVRYGTTEIVASTSSAAWQTFDEIFTANNIEFRLYAITAVAGHAEFDGVVLTSLGWVMDWVPANSAILTKRTDDPFAGLQSLRVAYGGSSNPSAQQICFVTGAKYRVTGKFKGDGTFLASIWHGATKAAESTALAVWQSFDVIFDANNTDISLLSSATSAGYAEFDDVVVTPLGYVMDWIPNDADLSKEDDGAGGTCLRVLKNGADPYAYQGSIFVSGEVYRIKGLARSDGMTVPQIQAGASVVWTGTASTAWQSFEIEPTVAGGTDFLLRFTGASGYAEFDDIEIERDGYVMFWSSNGAGTILDKWLGARTGGSGTRILKVDATIPGEGYAAQDILATGNVYKVDGWMKAESVAQVKLGDSVVVASPSTSWVPFSVTAVADGPELQLGASGGIGYFDDITLTLISGAVMDEPTLAQLAEWYPWWPYAPIKDVSRWWKGKREDVEYEIVRVRNRNFDWPETPYIEGVSLGNEVWLQGGDLTILFDYLSDDGAGALANGWSDIGTGDGTAAPDVALPFKPIRLWYNDTESPTPWLVADAKVRVQIDLTSGGADFDLYDVPDSEDVETGKLYPESGSSGEIDTTISYGTVNYLSGKIELDLLLAGDTSVSGQTIKGKWSVRGYFMAFYPPNMINRLSKDFGHDNDLNDPEDVQRSTIANLTKYFGLKASADSYRIRGEVSLFDVEVQGLWAMCDDTLWATIPFTNRFVYNGVLYTDINPRHLRFDDISGDVSFWNPDTSVWETLLDNSMMYEDSSVDGYSTGLAFALDVAQGYYGRVAPSPHPGSTTQRTPATVLSSTLLTADEAMGYGVVAGYRVEVSMMRVQWQAFNFNKGKFGLSEYDKSASIPPALDDLVFWIDSEEIEWIETSPGGTDEEDIGTWTIIIGVATGSAGPTVGSDVAIRYRSEIDSTDCCFCRSYRLKVRIAPTDEAYDFYGSSTDLNAAVERMKDKILDKIAPITRRVVDWQVDYHWALESVFGGQTQSEILPDNFSNSALGSVLAINQGTKIFTITGDQTDELYSDEYVSIQDSTGNDNQYQVDAITLNGSNTDVKVTTIIPSTVADGNLHPMPNRIMMTVEQRGDMGSGQTQTMKLYDDDSSVVWTATVGTGVSDADTWYIVAENVDVTLLIGNNSAVKIEASGQASMTYGDVKFTFNVSK